MRGQKPTALETALAQADRLSLLLHQATNRHTGATKEEVEAMAAMASVLTAVLKKADPAEAMPGEKMNQDKLKTIALHVLAVTGFLAEGQVDVAWTGLRLAWRLLKELIGPDADTEAEAWLRKQLEGLSE